MKKKVGKTISGKAVYSDAQSRVMGRDSNKKTKLSRAQKQHSVSVSRERVKVSMPKWAK
jgi:hypothetical protein